MKILLISHILPYPPKGGCPQRNFNLLKECSSGNEIDLLAFYRQSHQQNEEELNKAISEMKRYCRNVEVFPIAAERNKLIWYLLLLFNLFSPLPYSVWLYRSKKMKVAIKRYIEKYNYDVLEFGEIGLAKYAENLDGYAKILIHHNVESQLLYRRAQFGGNILSKIYLRIQAAKLRNFEKNTAHLFEFHTTVSADDKKTLLNISPHANIVVIPNGVDVDYFSSTNDPMDDNSIIYVGGVNWFPNYDAVMYFIKDIFPMVKKVLPGIRFHHVGYQVDDKLRKIAGESEDIVVHGFVDDVRPLITGAAVFIVPLRIGGGTRLKIVDALSMGKAIVSTSIGCEGINVADGENIAIADNPKDFAARIIELITDRDKRVKLMNNARKAAVDQYSWKSIAPKLMEAYRKSVDLKKKANSDSEADETKI